MTVVDGGDELWWTMATDGRRRPRETGGVARRQRIA
jgi:hypothetical protein